MSLVDAEQLNTSPLVYTVADILPENGAGFFWGPSGSGKTFTILDAALAIANGIPWLGHDTLPGTVTYAAGEGGGGLGIRIKARVLRQEQDDTLAIAAVARDQGDEAARSFAGSLPPYTSRNLKVTTKPFPMHFLRSNQPNEDLAQAMGELRRLNTPGPDDDPAAGRTCGWSSWMRWKTSPGSCRCPTGPAPTGSWGPCSGWPPNCSAACWP